MVNRTHLHLALLSLVWTFTPALLHADDLVLSRDGQAAAVVVLSAEPSSVEQHAAAELVKYVELMSRAKLTVCAESDVPGTAARVYIGTPATHSRIKTLLHDRKLPLPAEGTDGFLIKALRDGNRNTLVLAGASERACLYAAYHLLESLFHVAVATPCRSSMYD